MPKGTYSRLTAGKQKKVDQYVKGLKVCVEVALRECSPGIAQNDARVRKYLGSARTARRYFEVIKQAPEVEWKELVAEQFLEGETRRSRRLLSAATEMAVSAFVTSVRFYRSPDLYRVALQAAKDAGEAPPPSLRWFQTHYPGNY